jgi:chorismate synthase
MIYPSRADTDATWLEWVNTVAPFRRPCHSDLNMDLRYLSGIEDRELAVISARCAVASMMRRDAFRRVAR